MCLCVFVSCSGRQADVWQYSDVQFCRLPMTQGYSICVHSHMHAHRHTLVLFPSPTGPNWLILLSAAPLFSTSDNSNKKRKHRLCPWSKTSQWHLRKSLDNFKSSHALTHLSPATEETPFLVLHRKFLNALKPTNEKNRKDVVKVSLLYARHKVTVHRRDYVSLRWFIKK